MTNYINLLATLIGKSNLIISIFPFIQINNLIHQFKLYQLYFIRK